MIIAAMLRAQADGANVINLSLGFSAGWSEDEVTEVPSAPGRCVWQQWLCWTVLCRLALDRGGSHLDWFCRQVSQLVTISSIGRSLYYRLSLIRSLLAAW
jgi:hypothetical protein